MPYSALYLVRQWIHYASVYAWVSSPAEYEKLGFFWETTSGFIPVFNAIWFDSGYMTVSVYEAVSLVTVHLALCSFVVYVAVHKTAEIPQLQFITAVDTPFVAQKQILMVQTIQPFLDIAVAVRFLTVDVSVVLVVQILRCRCGEDFLAPTVQLAEKIVACRKLQLFRSCSSSWSSTSLSRRSACSPLSR